MKLGEICQYQLKSKRKASEGLDQGKYPFFTSSNVLKKYVNFYDFDGEYLIFGTGGKASVNYYHGKFSTSTDNFIVKVDCCSKYLWHYFQGNMHVLEAGFKGASIKHITKDYINNLSVPLPSLSVQQVIAAKFDTICDTIAKQKIQLKLCDDLIKSKFNEMFGDPNINLVKNGTKLIDCTTIVGGSTPKTSIEEYWNGALCWIAPAEINENSFIIGDTKRKITLAGAKSCSLIKMPIETVLLSTRAPIGKVAITSVEMYCNQGFKNFICDKTKILPLYLYFLLKYNTKQLNEKGRGATFKELSKAAVEEIAINIPTLPLQQQFADFVNQVEQSKTKIKQALSETETLYKALMQKHFGGTYAK